MATLELKDLTARYGKLTAVDQLNLSVGNGEFFVILGPSGAGKTTTLKSIAGLVDEVAGEVVIGGRSLSGVEPYHRNVAMAFESYALYPQRTVSQNLASPLKSGRLGTYSADEQRERIDAVTTTLGINHLLERFPRELSNGQRQRVALGRVLVRPADVYLLDEPLSHLDAKLRATMRAELKQLGAMSSTTTMYVTHDYQEALALGDRVAVLREGKIVQIGTPADVWNEPLDTFVAQALGQPEMNLIDAVVDGGGVRALDGELENPVPAGLGLSAGDAVRIGVRPRDLELGDADGVSEMLTLRGSVLLAERLGRAVELTVEVGGKQVIAVADDARIAEGEQVTLRVPLAKTHVFSDDGRRIGSLVGPRHAETATEGEVR